MLNVELADEDFITRQSNRPALYYCDCLAFTNHRERRECRGPFGDPSRTKKVLQPSVTKEVVLSNLQVYPNPANNYVEVKGKDLKTVEIFNALGVGLIKGRQFHDDIKIDLTSLSSGMYFIKVTDQNNRVTIKKIFKNIY